MGDSELMQGGQWGFFPFNPHFTLWTLLFACYMICAEQVTCHSLFFFFFYSLSVYIWNWKNYFSCWDRTHFADFWIFIRGLHWILQKRLFKFLKLEILCNVYRNMKTPNPSGSYSVFKFRLEDYFLLRLLINPVLFRIESLPKKNLGNVNHPGLLGVNWLVWPPSPPLVWTIPSISILCLQGGLSLASKISSNETNYKLSTCTCIQIHITRLVSTKSKHNRKNIMRARRISIQYAIWLQLCGVLIAKKL